MEEGQLAGLPSGTVTFLFTDLEGSTRRWDVAPVAMQAAVPRHDAIVTGAVEEHGGAVFKQVGDGLCAAFDTPIAAVRAAIEAQRALEQEEWPVELGEPLRSRMGVHTGTARARDGDYLGPALNRVARLMSAGHGGQILISSATERLVRDALPDGVTLLDLGSHRLRDLATPEQVYQICHPDLPAHFAPVRTSDVSAGNLPLQVTSFIGREKQLVDLAETLAENRLVTLTGVGGVGKTRLALQVASEILPQFLDGAWFVELAPVGEPDAVPHAVAALIGAQDLPSRTIVDSVIEALRPRQVLIILDNCEHLLDATGRLVEAILRACPHVTIIATSREPLAVDGERVWPVTSLAVPGRDEIPDPLQLSEIPAVKLFLDRARAARPDFAITDDNAPAVGEVCRRLDGVPLAIELAAARVRSMSAAEIAARLDERFRLLRSGRRTAMERHQTLRATVEWSYDLLGQDERVLFDRLSVFAGGFILEAAEQICAGDPIDEFDVADLVASLTEKSMLSIEDQPDGTTRFFTLETIRQYGEEKLLERGEAREVGERHAHYYADLTAESYVGIRGPNEARWVQIMDLEFDNIRAAHNWAMANGEVDLALGIAADIETYASWRLRGEVFSWLSAALALPDAERSDRYGDACASAAFDAGTGNDIDRAQSLGSIALERCTDERRRVYAMFAMGVRGFSDGDPASLELFAEAHRTALDAGDIWGAAMGEAARAMVTSYRGDIEAAIAMAEDALRLADRSGSPSMRAMANYAIGEVLQDTDPGRAATSLEEAAKLATSVRNRFVTGIATVTLATVKARAGENDAALRLLWEAVKEWQRRGNWRQQWVTLRNVVEELERIGRLEQAALLWGATQSDTAVSSWGPQEERLDALRERVEETLGAAARDAIDRGASMDPDDVVRFALAELVSARDELAMRQSSEPVA